MATADSLRDQQIDNTIDSVVLASLEADYDSGPDEPIGLRCPIESEDNPENDAHNVPRVRRTGAIPQLSSDDIEAGWTMDNGAVPEWSPPPCSAFRGPKTDECNSQPIDLFFDQLGLDTFQYIIQESNRYSDQNKLQYRLTSENLKKFLGLIIWFGLDPKPAYTDHFCSKFPAENEITNIMGLFEFRTIMSTLHFCDNEKTPKRGSSDHDEYFKLRYSLTLMKENWRKRYNPGMHVVVDESLSAFRGRLSFIQYNKSKHTRFGVKHFMLCCCSSGYVLDLEPYTGADPVVAPNLAGFSVSEKWALKLVNSVKPGQIVIYDNWYTSIPLFRQLVNQGIGAVGTMRQNRKGVPSTLKSMPKLDEPIHYRKNEVLLSTFSDNDKQICLLATVGQGRNVTTTQRDKNSPMCIKFSEKPQNILVYNRAKIGVDLLDQKSEPYTVYPHRCTKWYLKEFFRLVEISLVNSYIVYNTYPQNSLSAKNFRKKVVFSLWGNVLEELGYT